MKVAVYLISCSLPLLAIQAHAQSWICLEEMATGLYLNESTNKWEIANFRPTEKYLVAPIPEQINSDSPEVIPYGIKSFGEGYNKYSCKEGFFLNTNISETEQPDYMKIDILNCKGIGDFKFDRRSLRFLRTYPVGYIRKNEDGTENGNDTPLVAVGTCAPL